MTALTNVKINTPRVDEPEIVNTEMWPVVALVRLGIGKPKLDPRSLWIAQNDFKINNDTQSRRRRALFVADFILNSKKLTEDRNLAGMCQNWLRNKVSFLGKKHEKIFPMLWSAHNRCSKILGKPEITLEAFVASFDFAIEESKQENKKA